MNYIKAINAFYDQMEYNPLSQRAISLWFGLMAINNKARWEETFSPNRMALQAKTGLNAKGVEESVEELVEKGYLTVVSDEREQLEEYKMTVLYEEETDSGSGNGSGSSNGKSNTLSKQKETKEKEDDDTREEEMNSLENKLGTIKRFPFQRALYGKLVPGNSNRLKVGDDVRKVGRKLTATFTVSVLGSLAFVCLTFLFDSGGENYNLGNKLLMGMYFYLLYIGAIILFFGNLVSICIEWFHRKVKRLSLPVFVLLHGLFGLLNGVVFHTVTLALAGFMFAVLYALIDRWILWKKFNGKQMMAVSAAPVLLVLIFFVLAQWISEPMPPFEAEDAVEQATAGKGTSIEDFPDYVGTERTRVDGLLIERTTSVKEVEDEVYHVKFQETWWEESGDKHTNYMTYEVKRGATTLHASGGEDTPH